MLSAAAHLARLGSAVVSALAAVLMAVLLAFGGFALWHGVFFQKLFRCLFQDSVGRGSCRCTGFPELGRKILAHLAA